MIKKLLKPLGIFGRRYELMLAVLLLIVALVIPFGVGLKPYSLAIPIYLILVDIVFLLLATKNKWSRLKLPLLAGNIVIYFFWFETYVPNLINPDYLSSLIFPCLYFVLFLASLNYDVLVHKKNTGVREKILLLTAGLAFVSSLYFFFSDLVAGYWNYLALLATGFYLGLAYLTERYHSKDHNLIKTYDGLALLSAASVFYFQFVDVLDWRAVTLALALIIVILTWRWPDHKEA